MTADRCLTVVGLGPGDIRHLTLEAAEVLGGADSAWLRTSRHPAISHLAERFADLRLESFDHLYQSGHSLEEVHAGIVAHLLEAARDRDVVYCVPGSPVIGEATVDLLTFLAAAENLSLRVVNGMSFVEPVLALLGIADAAWMTLIDGVEIELLMCENALGELNGKPGRLPVRAAVPTAPVLISAVYGQARVNSVQRWLGRFWPQDHEVIVVRLAGAGGGTQERAPVRLLDRLTFDQFTSVFVPAVQPRADVATCSGLLDLTRSLRAPGGCPWDREQTHDSLKPYLLEEAYEALEALDEHDWIKLSEELGDLLFQITLHAQIAAERDEFGITDVIKNISEKLIRRHPHVFGDATMVSSAAQLERWEAMKQAERPARESILSGIPPAMPALPYSLAIQKRAGHQGFEWPTAEALLMKLEEELDEVRSALSGDEGRGRVMEELGDILFALVSVGRWLKIDPEEALRRANRKFVARFKHVEAHCKSEGRIMRELTPEELDILWEQSKAGS